MSSLQADSYPDNPVLVRIWRADAVECVHRGSWVLVDAAGNVLEGRGVFGHPTYARSTIKALQALPLVESGAAERFGLGDPALALACASHNAEPEHVTTVRDMLERIELKESALLCGVQVPADPVARRQLFAEGGAPAAVHNNCSGKHAGFLALAQHLGADPGTYLDPTAAPQRAVRNAVGEMCGVDPAAIPTGIDGCNAPAFRMPLTVLAAAFARLTSPDDLSADRQHACRRLVGAVSRHPELIAGNHERIDTDLLRVTGGRLFPKVGAEAVYVVGEVGGGRALALKMDDGDARGMHRALMGLLVRLELLRAEEIAALEPWNDPVMRNRAGVEVGREEFVF